MDERTPKPLAMEDPELRQLLGVRTAEARARVEALGRRAVVVEGSAVPPVHHRDAVTFSVRNGTVVDAWKL